MDGLAALESIGFNLSIISNASLTSVAGLMGVQHLGGSHLIINWNPLLSTCDAWDLAETLQARGFMGQVEISGNLDTGPCDGEDAGMDGGTDGGVDGGADGGFDGGHDAAPPEDAGGDV
jgi:hypothetical protein